MIETTVDISGLEEARAIHIDYRDNPSEHPEEQGDTSFHNRVVQEKDFVLETFRTGKRIARATSLLRKFKSSHEDILPFIKAGTSDPTLVGDVAWQEGWIKYYSYLLGQLGVEV